MGKSVKVLKLLVGELLTTISNGSFLVGKRHSSVITCIAPVCHLKSGINAVSDRQLMPVGVEMVFDLATCQGCFAAWFTYRSGPDALTEDPQP